MDFAFTGTVWFWRGPAPWHFVTVPDGASDGLAAISLAVSYGWGMIRATVRIGASEWPTALWPKDGGYIVPVKAWVREAEGIDVDDVVTVRLMVAAHGLSSGS